MGTLRRALTGTRAPAAPRSRGRWSLLAFVVCGGLSGSCTEPQAPPAPDGLSVAGALSGEGAAASGFARALEPRPFSFPEDHGPHPAFRTEWWYFTGNLETAEGRRVGYQLTFFRNALAPPADDSASGPRAPGQRPSHWATRQSWLAHFAVTDVADRTFHAEDRLARGGAIGLAGAAADRNAFTVRVADWSVRPAGDAGPATKPGPLGPVRLRAAQTEAAIDLVLVPVKPLVLQGEDGLSQKGGGAGNASYYYSATRLRTEGTVRLGERRLRVRGLSWMDREWSTSALAPDQAGWDWFSLQLEDGRDLMAYFLRLDPEADSMAVPEGDRIDPASSGTLVSADGGARHLARDDLVLEVLDRWRSPRTGAVYPSGWRLQVPDAGLDLIVRPVLEDQELDDRELDVGFRYWEGAVDVSGTDGERPVTGRGYVELTGYGDRPEASGPTGR